MVLISGLLGNLLRRVCTKMVSKAALLWSGINDWRSNVPKQAMHIQNSSAVANESMTTSHHITCLFVCLLNISVLFDPSRNIQRWSFSYRVCQNSLLKHFRQVAIPGAFFGIVLGGLVRGSFRRQRISEMESHTWILLSCSADKAII